MNLLYVYSGKARAGVGGIDLVVREQLRALVEAGHHVTFVSRGKYEHPQVSNICLPVTPAHLLSSLPARYYYNAQHRLFSHIGSWILRVRRFDAVVGWIRQSRSLFQTANALGVKSFLNCPITHYRDLQIDKPLKNLPWPHVNTDYLDEEYRRADILLTASPYARQSFIDHGIDSEKVLSIGRGADIARFHRVAGNSHPFRAVFFGMVCDRKGIFQTLDAWKEAAIDDGELWIIGNLPKEIRATVLSCMPHNAVLLGHRNDPEVLLPQCDVQILPTRVEGMAKSLVEGSACGLVSLTTRESGFPVIEGETGYYVERDDVSTIAAHLRALATDRPRLAEMSAKAELFVREHLSWAAFRSNFLNAMLVSPRTVSLD